MGVWIVFFNLRRIIAVCKFTGSERRKKPYSDENGQLSSFSDIHYHRSPWGGHKAPWMQYRNSVSEVIEKDATGQNLQLTLELVTRDDVAMTYTLEEWVFWGLS